MLWLMVSLLADLPGFVLEDAALWLEEFSRLTSTSSYVERRNGAMGPWGQGWACIPPGAGLLELNMDAAISMESFVILCVGFVVLCHEENSR